MIYISQCGELSPSVMGLIMGLFMEALTFDEFVRLLLALPDLIVKWIGFA